MTIWRRRSAPPVLLPSLDRLAGLIERVVELVDAVAVTPASDPALESESAPEPSREAVSATPPTPQAASSDPAGWLAFVPSPAGYRLVSRSGAPPTRGETVELEDGRYVVLRFAPSPLPADLRRCAFVGREETSPEERSPDA